MSETAKFLEGNLFRHVTVMSLTATFGIMALFLVDFVDMVFISMLGQAELAAAIGYAGAILFFTTSFSIGIAIAAGALVSHAVGAGDEHMARQRATNTIVVGVIVAAFVAVAVWFNLAFLVGLVGATDETQGLAVHYLSIVIPILPVLLVGIAGGAVLRAYGDARWAMMSMLVGGLTNAVLDPILIFGFGLGLTGAAIASVIGWLTISAMAIYPIIKYHGGFHLPRIRLLAAELMPITAIAVPVILTQMATPFGQAYVTRTMAGYGEAAVAAVAIISRMTPVAFAVVFALSGAIGPIIGQNAGAGRHDRVHETYRDGLLFTALIVGLVALLLFVIRGPVAGLFQAEGLTRELLFLFCGPLALMYYFNGVIFVSNAAFNNLNHPFYSTWINWGRQTLGTIPLVILGAYYLGAPGVLIGQAAGGIIFGAIAWWLALRVIEKSEHPHEAGRPHFHGHAKWLQLLHHRR